MCLKCNNFYNLLRIENFNIGFSHSVDENLRNFYSHRFVFCNFLDGCAKVFLTRTSIRLYRLTKSVKLVQWLLLHFLDIHTKFYFNNKVSFAEQKWAMSFQEAWTFLWFNKMLSLAMKGWVPLRRRSKSDRLEKGVILWLFV